MSVHQDCRMYEAKYPEVDDVVMVQVSDAVIQQRHHALNASHSPARSAQIS